MVVEHQCPALAPGDVTFVARNYDEEFPSDERFFTPGRLEMALPQRLDSDPKEDTEHDDDGADDIDMKLSKREASNSESDAMLKGIWLADAMLIEIWPADTDRVSDDGEASWTCIFSRELIRMKLSKLEASNSESEDDALIDSSNIRCAGETSSMEILSRENILRKVALDLIGKMIKLWGLRVFDLRRNGGGRRRTRQD